MLSLRGKANDAKRRGNKTRKRKNTVADTSNHRLPGRFCLGKKIKRSERRRRNGVLHKQPARKKKVHLWTGHEEQGKKKKKAGQKKKRRSSVYVEAASAIEERKITARVNLEKGRF